MPRDAGTLLPAATVWLAAGLVECAARGSAIPDDVQQSIRARVDYDYHVSIVVGELDPGGGQYFACGRTGLPDGNSAGASTLGGASRRTSAGSRS